MSETNSIDFSLLYQRLNQSLQECEQYRIDLNKDAKYIQEAIENLRNSSREVLRIINQPSLKIRKVEKKSSDSEGVRRLRGEFFSEMKFFELRSKQKIARANQKFYQNNINYLEKALDGVQDRLGTLEKIQKDLERNKELLKESTPEHSMIDGGESVGHAIKQLEDFLQNNLA